FVLFNDATTTGTYTLSLHDALPISRKSAGPATVVGIRSAGRRKAKPTAKTTRPPRTPRRRGGALPPRKLSAGASARFRVGGSPIDRKSTRLNSSHVAISYAVFCLKK